MDTEIIGYLKNHKKLILIIIFSIFIIIVLFIVGTKVWDYFITQKLVTLNPTTGTTITIGKQVGEGVNMDTIITKTSSKQEIRLEPGYYSVKYSGNTEYLSAFNVINVDKSMEIRTPKLNFTQEKLNQLILTEKNTAQSALSLSFDTSGYTIVDDKVYGQGDWYSARLINNNGSSDNLLIIMKKENTSWKLIAGPLIIISIGDYPDIPQEVIRQTNKLGFN